MLMDKIPASANLDPALLRALINTNGVDGSATDAAQLALDQAAADAQVDLQALETDLSSSQAQSSVDDGEMVLNADVWAGNSSRTLGVGASGFTANSNLAQLLEQNATSVCMALLNAK